MYYCLDTPWNYLFVVIYCFDYKLIMRMKEKLLDISISI